MRKERIRGDFRLLRPALDRHIAVRKIHADRDLIGIAVDHLSEKDRIGHGARAEDHAFDAHVDVCPHGVFRADAAADFDAHAALFDELFDDMAVRHRAVARAFQINHVQKLRAAVGKFTCDL